ncbi:acetyltransferase [Corynebacterium deserti GIMN1.010]|uniref:Acetyltransferase n=1 Tax=Corynebacterium deserti GIMN1.010 TaxID=931089 RepID=A0A0M5ILN4_9CORY|nr:GNAT family N-acetyltransferase [Corynebacterium deserti]ALC05024.1 acetyltransferase [Corynebacterium deserti GIMN1.010]
MYQLISPHTQGYSEWVATLEEFGDTPMDGSGFFGNYFPVDLSEAGFQRYLDDRHAAETTAPEGFVTCSYFWIIDDAQHIVGFLALRHELNQHLLEVGGHIGYSVRPSYRNKGVATAALKVGVDKAHDRGIERVLLCVKEDNPASQTVIERCGGQYESTIRGLRRYWFSRM